MYRTAVIELLLVVAEKTLGSALGAAAEPRWTPIVGGDPTGWDSLV